MASNRIHSRGPYRYEEYKANSALILPGMLLAIDSNGEVAPHSVVGGKAEAIFAVEDALQGINADTLYADNSIVACILPAKGSEVNAIIEDGQDIAIGDRLMSQGNGKLVVLSDVSGADQDEIVAIAVEANDLTGSNTSDTRSAVRIV